jgi:hypothetical protein
VSEQDNRYERSRERRLTLDDCPDCERRMTHVLTVGGGPDVDGGGTFLWCERHRELWLRVQGGRRQLSSRHASVPTLAVLRLRAELAAERANRPAPDGGEAPAAG